jgi:hypothetical protein
MYLQSEKHEVDPGPRVSRLHGVQRRLVQAVLTGSTLTGEVKFGVFPDNYSESFKFVHLGERNIIA